MYIHGHFYNEQNDRIEVHIVTRNDRTKELEIGTAASGISWTDDPVEIESQVSDTFDVLLKYQASVRLLVKNFIPDLFCASCRDAIINIYREGECLFAGFIEPQAYSQPYNENEDEIELSCIDVLTALQYAKYRNIGSTGVSYSTVKARAEQRSFLDILKETLNGLTTGLDLVDGHSLRYLFDGSKAVDGMAVNRYNIFTKLSISELLFLGDEEDEVWQQENLLEELLKYLNLHIVQIGFVFYIFSWESLMNNTSILWRDIITNQELTEKQKTVTIETDIVADCNTTINIGDVYNQILLTCKIQAVENIIESPLDSKSLVPLYTSKQKYCTEYSADGEGAKAWRSFRDMCHDRETDYGGAQITDWYVRVKTNPKWSFPKSSGGVNLIEELCRNNKSQQVLPNYLAQHPGAAIIEIGSVAKNMGSDDNSPISKVSMDDYLVIGVNGNGEDEEKKHRPNENDIKDHIPYAVYESNSAGGVFSPTDDMTTNYIVLSGKMTLNPLMDMTDTFRALHNDEDWGGGSKWWHATVPSRTNKDGRYYTRRYWKADTPKDDEVWDTSTDHGLIPFSGRGPEEYKYTYSEVGDTSDKLSKVAVLACMLIIGDKCVVETGKDGQVSDFRWQRYKTREQCANDDEYYSQCFTLGFDPKHDDKLVGVEYSIQNNVYYSFGIDAEGTAIPIKKTDKVSGPVKFMILGPVVNVQFNDITKRHRTWFRHQHWTEHAVPLLSHVSSIYVKDFEVKIYSDGGKLDNSGDNDLVYLSDTQENFLNKKDDIEFKINSALTSEESAHLGVKNTINLSTPLNDETGAGVTSIYDHLKKRQSKPEKLYVDSYYNEYHQPRVVMEQNFVDRFHGVVSPFWHYMHPALGKTFFVLGISRSLMEGSAKLTLKEIGQ